MDSIITALQCALFLLCLLCAAWHDAQTLRIPNRFIAGLILWRLVGVLTEHTLLFWRAPFAALAAGATAVSVFASAALGAGAVAGIAAFAAAVSRIILKRRGIGAGDIKLFFASTLYLGFEKGLYLLLLSSLMFLICHSISACKSTLANNNIQAKKAQEKIHPFGPFISLCAAFLYLL